jgi:hypothetical protein
VAKNKPNGKAAKAIEKRPYVSQGDIPSATLTQALRVAAALADEYGTKPTSPLRVAEALGLTPQARPFRMLTGASIAYGLTEGGQSADQISLTPLGKRIVAPTVEGDDAAAKREAFLRPRIIGEFLKRYNNSAIPKREIGLNVLRDMGVPQDRAGDVFDLIVEGAETLGMLRPIKDKQFVDLSGIAVANSDGTTERKPDDPPFPLDDVGITFRGPSAPAAVGGAAASASAASQSVNRRVFITHGKDTSFIDPIKKLLGFGEMIPVVSVEKQSVSKPVPDKVMDDMRSCSAAIIHVGTEKTLIDPEANEHKILNPNVLIEIGAAMALYGRRFILLAQEGTQLPSNLQGLYEVRYKGEALDGNATIRLLEAINDIKNNPLPERYKTDH